jgi:dihydrofolate reductase
MRKLKLELQVSLDGFMADQDGGTNWMVWNWGPDWTWDVALQQYHTRLTTSADCFFISRQMAEEGFVAHWAKAAENKTDPRYEFAKHITDSKKNVFSTTLSTSTSIPGGWDNIEIVGKDYVAYIHDLKRKNGKDILIYGGATLVSSLIQAGLVDEFYFIVNPVAIGRGLSIFNGLQKPLTLKLMSVQAFECGVAVQHYISV